MSSHYHERSTARGEDEQLMAPHSPTSSTSSISNPALLGVQSPGVPTGNHPTGFQDIAPVLRLALCATMWLGGGATLLGLVGHSVGWVILQRAGASASPDVACIADIGTAGATILTAPAVAIYLAATSLLRSRGWTTGGAQFSPYVSGRYHQDRGRAGRYHAFVVVFVLYGAVSGALGSAMLEARCETRASVAASVGAMGWFVLALVCVMFENISRELSVLRAGGTEPVREAPSALECSLFVFITL